ncbi:uncharacterized protein V1518DRAFT_417453 [Limtongia smithiae]|uniref:uncharacterized protein n=1 Tax=Limtongia smithiae TaxID=1125753 RepID=UPI0034CE5918
MQDIHSPSVSSDTSSQLITSHIAHASHVSADTHRASVVSLTNRRAALESELDALADILATHGATMDTPLVSRDGYPRADIDVAQVRFTRTRIIMLRNDLKTISSQIEEALFAFHAANSAVTATASKSSPPTTPPIAIPTVPFAVVDTVADNSPASLAGLLPGDRILSFADIHAGNHDRLAALARTVQKSENIELHILLLRHFDNTSARAEIHATLTPRRGWGGQGLLGCRVLPL